MKTIKIDKEKEYVIAVVAPREKGKAYNAILAGVIKTIDLVEYNASLVDVQKNTFVFVHNGVSSGALGHVIEVVNKIQPLLRARGRNVTRRKLDLDIEFYGRKAQDHWLEQVIGMQPDIMLILDDGVYSVAGYAKKLARENKIETHIVNIPKV